MSRTSGERGGGSNWVWLILAGAAIVFVLSAAVVVNKTTNKSADFIVQQKLKLQKDGRDRAEKGGVQVGGSGKAEPAGKKKGVKVIADFKVIAEYPHDPLAFTQGVEYKNYTLYETTGSFRSPSSVRIVDLKSGDVKKKELMPKGSFGEGCTIVGENLLALTWKSKKAYVYNKDTLEKKAEIPYHHIGWGLAYDEGRNVMYATDGGDHLYRINPSNWKATSKTTIKMDGIALREVNELEYINGYLFGNVWHKPWIVKIKPTTGEVVGVLDLSSLVQKVARKHVNRGEDVLNGIAYREETGNLLVTGKLWPVLFELETPFVQ
mmetsp:Transcript_37748/g.97385  ORF Transcript_37748/g.97385 Transcript_37748/m.97385 type:complete len:321 (-) Transcript_37748:87-1049(-)